MVLTGFNALRIVSLIAFFVGMVLAFQGAYQLEKVGASYFVAALVGVSMTREMGAVICNKVSDPTRGGAACPPPRFAAGLPYLRNWRRTARRNNAIKVEVSNNSSNARRRPQG